MERTLVETYRIIADLVPATVNIWRVRGELVPFYEIIMPQIDKGTLAVLEDIKEELARTLLISIEEITDPHRAQELRSRILTTTVKLLEHKFPSMAEVQRSMMAGMLLHKVYGIGELEVILQDNFLEEIVINSSHTPISVYHKKYGWVITNKTIPNEESIYNLSAQIGRRIGRQITLLTPIMDAYLLQGDRVASTIFPISTAGNTITIRKFARTPWNIITLIKSKTTSVEILAFLWLAVQYERSILVAGATAAGKTSMLNAICVFIPPSQRIISIEDTREILLPEALRWNWVPLNSRLPNSEGQGEVTMLDLMVASLRMRPDRIIIGEVRRKEQAETMFEAMNTGHAVYATIHADNVEQVKRRLLEPPISVPKNEVESLPLILVQYRDMRHNSRRTLELAEVLQTPKPYLETNYLYRWFPRTDTFEMINESQRIFEDLNLHTGLSTAEAKADIKEKEEILLWMARHDVADLDLIGSLMKAYYFDKNIILNLMKFDKTTQRSAAGIRMKTVPLLIFKPGSKQTVILPWLSEKIALFFPGLKYDIEQADIEMSAQRYSSLAILNALAFGSLLAGILFIAFHFSKGEAIQAASIKAITTGLEFSFVILLVLLLYPRIIAGKKAEAIDNSLIFALKDLHLQSSAGVNLYHAIVNVSGAGYGEVSKEFALAVQRIETGMALEKSLEQMALETKSHHLKKTLWQLINSMRAGASIKETLSSLITELKSEQYAKIREYGQELNMMILMYLLFAIAIPSIGATMLIVLSGFGGGGITQATFISFGAISMTIQIVLITFIKSRRPAITF